jgi:hypothetical protein
MVSTFLTVTVSDGGIAFDRGRTALVAVIFRAGDFFTDGEGQVGLAAGTVVLKTGRMATNRTSDATRRNMSRVSDVSPSSITVEMESRDARLRFLRREAEITNRWVFPRYRE